LSAKEGGLKMLAQNFKSATDLKITEKQKQALIKTLVLLETKKLTHMEKPISSLEFKDNHPVLGKFFNMDVWASTYESCGTVSCIGGTAEIIGGPGVYFSAISSDFPKNLLDLFYPNTIMPELYEDITTEQAATALRNYLTTGKPNWKNVK
jgi:hypothetical protein